MNISLVRQFPPAAGNPRNSEGAFLRGKLGEILFAYSRYVGDSNHDHATCNVALTVSHDEGLTWSEPRIIARAREDFGTQNIMSVSALTQENGDLSFYFLVKENDFSTSLARARSSDGVSFVCERCETHFPRAYYVINNDRLVRTRDGSLLAPAAYITAEQNRKGGGVPYTATCLVSHDDGETFSKAAFDFTTTDRTNARYGLQEPGIIETETGFYYWMRTGYGRQYESVSQGALEDLCTPSPSPFTSPPSPMQIKEHDGVLYNAYNPKPRWNGYEEYEKEHPGVWSRSPMVLRISKDEGKTWGPMNIVGDDPDRGYSYPAMFFTNDGHLLLGICRGSGAEGNNLCTLGIVKIDLSTVE